MSTHTHTHQAHQPHPTPKSHTGPLDWRRLVEWLQVDRVIYLDGPRPKPEPADISDAKPGEEPF